MQTKLEAILLGLVAFGIFWIALALLQGPTEVASAQTPTPFLVTPYFGMEPITQQYTVTQYITTTHRALDFGMSYERVLASADGTIVSVDWANDSCHQAANNPACSYGLYIVIDHADNYRTIYAHLSATAYPRGPVGLPVKQGQIVGTSGHTGNSTGPHLHFEVRHNGTKVNPSDEDGVSLWVDGWIQDDEAGVESERPFPGPVNGGEIILDDSPDNLAGFSKGSGGLFNGVCAGNCGGWIGSATGYENDSYFTPADGNAVVDNWARWQPQGLPSGGDGVPHEVYVHVPNVGTRTWQAPYTLVNSSGVILMKGVVDQFGLPNLGFEWVSIGIRPIQDGSYLYTTDATGEPLGGHCGIGLWCDLTVDAVKFVRRGTTYLPDIRTVGGWTTTTVIRNNGAGPARVRLAFYNNGVLTCGITNLSLPRHAIWAAATCGAANTAILDSDQNTSVVALHSKTGGLDADNGMLPYGFGDLAFENAHTTQNVPAMYNSYDNWNSTVQILNTSAVATDVGVNFYGRPGTGYCDKTQVVNIAAYSRYTLSASEACSNPWVGSLVLSTGQPLAVQAMDTHVDQGTRTSNASAYRLLGLTRLFAPTAYLTWNGLTSSIVVQNILDSNPVNVDLTFYNRDGTLQTTYIIPALEYGRAKEVYLYDVPGLPYPWSGSVDIYPNGGRIAARVSTTHSSGGRHAYSAVGLRGSDIYLARASKNASGRTTSYILQNVGAYDPLTVTATYYDSLGNVTYTTTLPNLPALGSAEYSQANDPLPDGWTGSIWLSANSASLTAMVRVDSSSASGAYNGSIPCSSSIYGQCSSVGE